MKEAGLNPNLLFYQDFNEQFEGYTQLHVLDSLCRCIELILP